MPNKKEDLSVVSYVIGILSIVFAFFQPLAAIVLGIVGVVQSKNQNDSLSKKAKKYSIIGIVLGIIIFVLSLALAYYLTGSNFPIA